MYKIIWFSSRHSPDGRSLPWRAWWIKLQGSGISLKLCLWNFYFPSSIFEVCGAVSAVLRAVKLHKFHWHFSYISLVCKGTMKFPFLSILWPCGYVSSRVSLFSMTKKIGLSKRGPRCYHVLNAPKTTLLYSKRSFTSAVSEIKGKQVSLKHLFFNTTTKNNDLVLSERSRKKISSHLWSMNTKERQS